MSTTTTSAHLPHVTALPRLNTRGWYGEPDQLETCARFPALDLFAHWDAEYKGETCFVQYVLPDRTPLPRLNRSALAKIAGMPLDQMVRIEVIFVDLDYPNHEVPPETWHHGVLAKLPDAMRKRAGWYRTPHGMRLVFLPPKPIPLIYAHDVLHRFHDILGKYGIHTDHATRDWTRLFRAPRAFNRDLPRDFSKLRPLTPDLFPPESTWEEETPSSIAKFSQTKRPADTAAVKPKPQKEVNALIKNKALAHAIYTRKLTAPEGERHATVLQTAIQIVQGAATIDPATPYDLLAPCLDSLNEGASREMDLAELWRICEWAAAQVAGRKEHQTQEKEKALSAISAQMGVSRAVARSAVILDTGKAFFVWDEETLDYSPPYTNQRQLIPALHRHAPNIGMGVFDTSEALLGLSSPVTRVTYSYLDDKAVYDPRLYMLTVPAARIDSELKPTYHEDVAKWLETMCASKHDLDHLLDWLAVFPDTTRPICALFLDGPPGIGKALLANGLARLWNAPAPTSYQALVQRFNASLRECPLVWADESVPKDATSEDDSGIFRRTIGNSTHSIEAKHVDVMQLRGYLRVLMTANNAEIFSIRENLNPSDIDAVRQRIGYIRIPRGPEHAPERSPTALYLEGLAAKYGKPSVRDVTQAWIDDGLIAEHVLWLAETRQVKYGGRFAVEGWESDVTRNLSVAHGAAGVVAATAAQAVFLGTSGHYRGGAVRWFGGKVYVNADRLAPEWEDILGHPHDRPPRTMSIRSALKSLSQGREQKRLEWERQMLRYYELDAHLIGTVAAHNGVVASAEEFVAFCQRPTEPKANASFSAPSRLGMPKMP